MNVKIKGDGRPTGTTITTASGENLTNRVSAVEFRHDCDGVPNVVLRLHFAEIDYEGAAKFVAPNGKAVKSIIYDDGTQDDF